MTFDLPTRQRNCASTLEALTKTKEFAELTPVLQVTLRRTIDVLKDTVKANETKEVV